MSRQRSKLTVGEVLKEVERTVRNNQSFIRDVILKNMLEISEEFHGDLIQLVEKFFDILNAIRYPRIQQLRDISIEVEKLRGILDKLTSEDIRNELRKLIWIIDYRLLALQSRTDLEQILERIRTVHNKIERYVINNITNLVQNESELSNLARVKGVLKRMEKYFEELLKWLASGLNPQLVQLLYAHKHVNFLTRKELRQILAKINEILNRCYRPHKVLELLAYVTGRVGPYTISPLFELPLRLS